MWRGRWAYQAWTDTQNQVFLTLLALCGDGVGEDGDTAASMTISERPSAFFNGLTTQYIVAYCVDKANKYSIQQSSG